MENNNEEVMNAIVKQVEDEQPEDDEDDDSYYDPNNPRPMSAERLRKIVRYEVNEAIDFLESELAQPREQAQEYFNGKTKIKHEKGRSAVIVTKVRDTVRQLLPSLMRMFLQGKKAVEFKARTGRDAPMVMEQQQTCESIFWNNGGYHALLSALTDAMNKKTGILWVYRDKCIEGVIHSTEVMSYDEMDEIEEQGARITEVTPLETFSEDEETGESVPLSKVSFIKYVEKEKWCIDPVAPEDFIISKDAKTLEDARLVGIYCNKRVSDLIEVGFEWDDIKDYTYDNRHGKSEKTARRGHNVDPEESDAVNLDPSAQQVAYTDVYIRVDADGDGYAELRHVIVVGEDQDNVLLDEPANFKPYAVFVTDYEPHAFFPMSINESTQEDQDAQTAMLRSIVDNAALTNSPRTVLNPQYVNIEDHMNNEIGSTIRATDIEQIKEFVTPFVAKDTLPVLQYLEQVCEKRTGLVNAFQGTDPDSLQSVSRQGTNALIQGGQAMIQMIGRNLAQGMYEVFVLIQKSIVWSDKKPFEIRTPDSQYITIDPTAWHTAVDYKINVGLGTGTPEELMPVYSGIAVKQEAIVQELGPGNPICSWYNLRHTYSKMLGLFGIEDVDSYFPDIDPKMLFMYDQKLQQQRAEAAQKGGPGAPGEIFAAEKYKADKKQETDLFNARMKATMEQVKEKAKKGDKAADILYKIWEANMQDDRMRDKDAMDFFIEENRIELEHEVQLDKNELQAEVAKDRNTNGAA